MESLANDLIKFEGRRLNKPEAFELTNEQADALLNLFDNDLGAAIEFVSAQEAAMKAEHPIQNVPPDEAGELAQREFE